MGKTTELMQLLKTGNSDSARKLIAKMKKAGKKKLLAKELVQPDESAQGQTVMHFCAAQNFVEFIHDLADLGAPIDTMDDRGFTPLHLAALSGRTSAVSALLGKGADPNVASHNGDTPLHLACSGGHAGTVDSLIVAQANATGFNVSGHTPLDLACQHGHVQAVTVLLRSGQFSQAYLQRSDIPHTALLLAAKSGHNEVIGQLVKHGFDVNRKLPGANGNCFHEAALYGKVETVKYLLVLGADVQVVNHQGLTALDIVNMYTDPRSAGLMKQVLQDAMAQQARARIAQQAQPSHPHQGHPSQASHPHQGHPSQQQYQRQPSQDSHYQQPTAARTQQQQAHQPHASQQAPPPRTGPSPTPSAGRQPGFSYIMPGMVKARSDSEPQQPRQPSNHTSQQAQAAAYQQQQQQQHSGYHSQSQAHSAYAQQRSQSIQPQTHSNSSYGQPRSQVHPAMNQRAQSLANQPTYDQLSGVQQQYSQQQQQHQQYAQQHQQYSQQQQQYAQQQQHGQAYGGQQGYQQQGSAHGTPDTQHREVGGATPPMDLASQIKAKLATRKPMATSPTQKDFPAGDDPFKRSSTMSSTSSMGEIRQAVLKRRGSLTEHRSSSSPDRDGYDRSNPPTLPRRGHAGPPSFTPVPPPEGETATLDRPRRKPQPKPPPPQEPDMDNELLKKLMRRQNRIQKAQEEGVESLDPKIDEPVSDELPSKPAATAAPPPIPQRKTAALTESKELSPPPPPPQSQPPPSRDPPPPQPPPTQPPPSQPPIEESPSHEAPKVKSKPRAKPPPPKPKKEEPEVPPWQMELQKRKERRAQEAIEIAESMMVEKKEDEQPAEVKAQELPPPKEPTPPPAPPTIEPTPPPPAEKQEAAPPPVAVKQKPSPSARRKIESKPPIPPPATAPPPVTVPPPAPIIEPPTEPLPPANPPPSSAQPQTLPIAAQGSTASGQPGTPSSELSRSTSLSSLPTTGSPLHISEPIPIGDWLSSYKLSDYMSLFEGAGYDTTDFLKGITTDELTEIGVQKPGHKKKIMTALANVHHKEHLLLEKPATVTTWLTILGLVQYEEVLIDAGYDDIDFISDISSEELQDIGITKKGHLKRFMRGIAELVEVSKSAPPTPSPVPRAQHVNGHATPLEDSVPPFVEDSKTPEPQDDDKIIAPPSGFDEPDLKRNSQNLTVPPVAAKPKRISQDEATLFDPSRSRTYSGGREGSVPADGGGGLNKMRHLLEQQMGSSRSTESLEMSVGSESSEPMRVNKSNSRSPSHSPRVPRKPQNLKGPPPAPKRSSQTQLSMGSSMQSLSSSTSSLSSTSALDKRASGDIGQLVESPPKVPAKKRKPEATTEVTRVPIPTGMDATDFGGEPSSLSAAQKTYSVEDITAALDDMVSDDEFLNDMARTGPGRVEPREPVRREPVRNEPPSQVRAEPVKSAPVPAKKVGNANEELDALSKALQGFDQAEEEDENETEEADQLLADIDDMLADLNSRLDFITPEDVGTDV